ncbi:hypothetical protein PG989_001354 [Apiospora arundinis]
MEPIGFALGIASLFTTCVDCFELVQSGRYLGQEYHLLETKFINQRIRLVAWGKACGFTDPNGYDRQIDENKEVHDAIEASLLHLIGLLRDGDKLKRKYGLRDADQPVAGPHGATPNVLIQSSHTWPLLGAQSAMTSLTQRLAKFRDKTKATQQQANLWNKARWAIMDKEKFAELVQHLRDLIEDLEGLTAGLHLEHRQRELIRQEVEAIREIPVLESIEEARVGRLDPVSDAASLRLWSVRDRFSFSPTAPGDSSSRRSRFSLSQRGDSQNDRSPWLAGEDPVGENNAMFCSPADMRSEISDEDWEALSRVHSLSSSPSPGLDDSNSAANYQVLYRVHCDFCSPAIYMDVPDYGTECSTTNQWMVLDEYHPLREPKTLHLCGKRLIQDLDTYLSQNRQLHFIVFQEYQCRHELDEQQATLRSNSTPDLVVANGQSIYMVSEELCVAMRYLAAQVPGMQLPDFEPQAELLYPFYWFYLSRQILEKELSSLEESSPMALAKELVDFMSDSTSMEYPKIDELLSRGVITWNTLRYLFAPDDIVIQKHADGFRRCQAYRVIDAQWAEATIGTADVTLKVYYVACQDRFIPLQKSLTITKGDFEDVDSEVAIEELPILPLRYDPRIIERSLVDRSRKLTGFSENPFDFRYRWVCYTGTEVDSTVWMDNMRLIIDPNLYWQLHHQSSEPNLNTQPKLPPRRSHHATGPVSIIAPEVLTSRDLPLLQPTVHGFDLCTHEWRHLYVADLRETEWNINAFDDLILDKKEKELLLGSVQSASLPNVTTTAVQETNQQGRLSSEDDGLPPPQKRISVGDGGGGSVYLFHGGPGTGKTFATSCISERTRKPLYHMTPFATGVSAEAVQHNMDATLALAQRWDCMLVLEDADATANGGSGDNVGGSHIQHEVPRRAMTMALVKLLDAFGGIVVLNSSRVGILDDALFSRVHLAIYFPELDAGGRGRIWHDALSDASTSVAPRRDGGGAEVNVVVDGNNDEMGTAAAREETAVAVATTPATIDPYLLSPDVQDKLAAVELNGREIRNVVAQSLRIARFQGEALRMELVESVLWQAVKLQEYRASLQGKAAVLTPSDNLNEKSQNRSKKALEDKRTSQREALLPSPPPELLPSSLGRDGWPPETAATKSGESK